jgi:hypothetical protein
MFVSARLFSVRRTVYWGLLIGFVLALGLFLPGDSNGYQGWPCYGCYGCQPVPCCGPTEYRVGELQIFIVGHKRDAIEVYFKDNFFRFRILDDTTGEPLTNLHCRLDVITAPDPSRHGTVAIRYGKRFERLIVFGWYKYEEDTSALGELYLVASNTEDLKYEGDTDEGASKPKNSKFGTIPLDENYPVIAKWIRPGILRVRHGKCGERVLVIRLEGGEKGWRILYATDSGRRSGLNLPDAVSAHEILPQFRKFW